jgi:hypothetical protein
VPLKERLGELLAAIFVFAFLLLMAFGMYTWLVDDVLPVKWSNAIEDVFISADKKREIAENLLRLAAGEKLEADTDLKELEPPNPDYDSERIDSYLERLAEINDRYRNAEQLADRAVELQRKANSSKPPGEPKQQ